MQSANRGTGRYLNYNADEFNLVETQSVRFKIHDNNASLSFRY